MPFEGDKVGEGDEVEELKVEEIKREEIIKNAVEAFFENKHFTDEEKDRIRPALREMFLHKVCNEGEVNKNTMREIAEKHKVPFVKK